MSEMLSALLYMVPMLLQDTTMSRLSPSVQMCGVARSKRKKKKRNTASPWGNERVEKLNYSILSQISLSPSWQGGIVKDLKE